MRSPVRRFIIVTALFFIWAPPSMAQEMVKESSTKKMFLKEVTFSHDSTDYTVTLTGLTVRKKFVVKVYGIAHYMQDAGKSSKEDAFKAVLADGKAKQITMDFSRNVGFDKIQGSFKDGFKKNASAEELKEIQPLVDQFLGYFDKEVKKNEQYILRWLAGGTVITIVQGEEKPAITNLTFAKVLWKIWLGKHSIVNEDKLVKRIVSK